MCIRDRSKPSEGVITIAPGATVAEAAKLLSDRRIGAVIVSRDGERAEGILSERDIAVSYTHLRAHETVLDLVCRLLLAKKKHKQNYT